MSLVTVDVGAGHELPAVLQAHRPAVLDAKLVRNGLGLLLRDVRSNEFMRLLRLLRCRNLGANE